jgi:HEAT repeat protein
LAKRGDAAALPIFQRIARAGSLAQPVRLAAVRCLIELGPASAAPILLGLLKEDDRDIARAAQEGLAALPGKEIDTLVLRLLGSAEAGQRLLALELIGQRRMKKALPALIEKLNDTDNSVRSAALKGLGELGTTAELPMLLDRLLDTRSSQDLKALEQAVSTLCAKSDNPEQSTGKLAGLLNRASPAQKIVLLRVLAQAGGPTALAAIRASVKDADPEVHAAAIRTLSTWKTTEVIPDLLALAKEAKDPTDRQLGLRSYLGLATRTTIPPAERLSMCKQASTLVKNPEDKKLLLAALGVLNSPGALPLILPHLEDPATNEEAAAAAVVLAERLLKGRDRPRVASQLIGPLEKVAKATTNADLARRAQEAAKLAKSKAGVK